VLVQRGGKWGDAAPLEGWSRETVADVMAWREGVRVPASLAAALEAVDLEFPVLRDEVPVNALLDGAVGEVFENAVEAAQHGCRCVKIKTRGVPAAELVGLVERIQDATGGVAVRIDSNRGWDFGTAVRMAEALAGKGVEYFEEPVGADAMERFVRESPVPVALDETLREVSPEELGRFSRAAALVLKPTLMGGFSVCRRFADAGGALGMRSVVSACFESGVGIYSLGRFAASLPLASAAGLDTYSRLEGDVLQRRLDLGGFVFRANEAMPEVDESVLF